MVAICMHAQVSPCKCKYQHQHKTCPCKCKHQWAIPNSPCVATQDVHACPADLLKHVQVNMATLPGTTLAAWPGSKTIQCGEGMSYMACKHVRMKHFLLVHPPHVQQACSGP
eukprot:2395390-Lingulodinium_polyedra.AAC.1